LKKNKNC